MFLKCNKVGHYATRKSSLRAFVKPGMTPPHEYDDNSMIISYQSEQLNGRSGVSKYVLSLCLRCYLLPSGERRVKGCIPITNILFSIGPLLATDTFW